MEEIEIKFLDIDRPALETKLASLGAKKVGDCKIQSSVAFLTIPRSIKMLLLKLSK